MTAQPEAPDEPEASSGPPTDGADSPPRPRRDRSDHAIAAARAQAAAAARTRVQLGERPVAVADREQDGAYAGLVTRAIAYSLDLLLISIGSLLVGAALALASLLVPPLPSEVKVVGAVALAGAQVLWTVGYFATFWSATGQTPGSRLMRIRVIDGGGAAHISLRRAIVRFVGVVLAGIPLFAGFLIMLWDDRRRCLQDRIARTTVVHAPPQARIVRQRIPRGRE